MDKIKTFLQKKSLGFYFSLCALLFSGLGMILYSQTGITEFSTALDATVFITGGIGCLLALANMVFELRLIADFSMFALLWSFIAYVGSQAYYLANLLVSIDGSSFSVGFLFCILSLLLAFAFAIASICLTKKKEAKDKVEIIQEDKVNE